MDGKTREQHLQLLRDYRRRETHFESITTQWRDWFDDSADDDLVDAFATLQEAAHGDARDGDAEVHRALLDELKRRDAQIAALDAKIERQAKQIAELRAQLQEEQKSRENAAAARHAALRVAAHDRVRARALARRQHKQSAKVLSLVGGETL
jgi:cell division septum initiation protein DivIVA